MIHVNTVETIEYLGSQFSKLHWDFKEEYIGGQNEIISQWQGDSHEDIMACVCSDSNTHEIYHRQDFFFLNFAYRGDYHALSHSPYHRIAIHEGECYIGQPFSGYAIDGSDSIDFKMVGIHIRRKIFFRDFLPVLSADSRLFRFFLEPETNCFADNTIILDFGRAELFRATLEAICLEYADHSADTQDLLRPLTLGLLMQVARQYKKCFLNPEKERLSDEIIRYMNEHADRVKLKDIAAHFSYHPNYISNLLHKEYCKTFSEILNDQRMERAKLLLQKTELTIEEIADMLGYSAPSNFYKAFRKSNGGMSPREFMSKVKN